MKIDGGLGFELDRIPDQAKALEANGYDGALTFETSHDPFLPLLLAAEHTSKISLMTSIAVAFARNPMILANLAHDLNSYSKGRFKLGLGSQIKPHITKRYSMPWGSPAAQMKELIEALHAIWDCWYEGKELNYRGEHYKHTLMTPMFTPLDIEHGRPDVILAAVGPKMTETAASVADGMLVHPFTTERYLREVTLPTLESTLEKHGRKRADFEVVYSAFAITADTEEQFEAIKTATKKQISFYGSTPAYRVVLDLHGWGELQTELNLMSKQGRWDEMGELITDDILDAFAVVGEPESVARGIGERYGSLIDRTSVQFPGVAKEKLPDLMKIVRGA
jgi:probable F420-dependent oxidoreductase